MAPGPGIEPGPHWWKASALTTAPSLSPLRHPCSPLCTKSYVNKENLINNVSQDSPNKTILATIGIILSMLKRPRDSEILSLLC